MSDILQQLPQLPKDIITYAMDMNDTELNNILNDTFDSIGKGVINRMLQFFGFRLDIERFKIIYNNILSSRPHPRGLTIEFICYCIAYKGETFEYVVERFIFQMKTTFQEYRIYDDKSLFNLELTLHVAYISINNNDVNRIPHNLMKEIICKMCCNGLEKREDVLYQLMDHTYTQIERCDGVGEASLIPLKEFKYIIAEKFGTEEGNKFIEDTRARIYEKYPWHRR